MKKPLKRSMKRRAGFHDYSAPGTYMLTVVCEGRRPLLGQLRIGETIADHGTRFNSKTEFVDKKGARPDNSGLCCDGNAVEADVVLTPFGEEIKKNVLKRMSKVYPQVSLWRVCIMPDHIHMIIKVCRPLPKNKHLGHVIAGFKRGCNTAFKKLGDEIPTERPILGDSIRVGGERPVLGDSIRVGGERPILGDSIRVGGERPVLGDCFAERAVCRKNLVFEEGYNDRLLFDGKQLERWKHYLDDNPRRLALKRLHPDFFTVLNGKSIGPYNCQMIGNPFLLDIPDKVAVIVHSVYSDETFARKKREWLACGERGGVIVSAAIAPREREVMREAMDRGYSLIWLRYNGFPKMYKPAGEAFDSCACGQLLEISPWEYAPCKGKPRREECLELNHIAEIIVGDM